MSQHPRVRWWALLALAVGAVPLTWLVVLADGWTVNRLVVAIWNVIRNAGFPLTPEHLDVALNTLMLVPFALLAGVGLPRVPWWVWAVLGFGLSVSVEFVQFHLTRDASALDVATNTAGAFLGAFGSALINDKLASRQQV